MQLGKQTSGCMQYVMFADSYLLCFKIQLWSALATPEGKHQAAICLFSDCFSQLPRHTPCVQEQLWCEAGQGCNHLGCADQGGHIPDEASTAAVGYPTSRLCFTESC
jgi:hypothetical protein